MEEYIKDLLDNIPEKKSMGIEERMSKEGEHKYETYYVVFPNAAWQVFEVQLRQASPDTAFFHDKEGQTLCSKDVDICYTKGKAEALLEYYKSQKIESIAKEHGVTVKFGLEQHIPQIERMLKETGSNDYTWGKIGKEIHWCPVAARDWYIRYLREKIK